MWLNLAKGCDLTERLQEGRIFLRHVTQMAAAQRRRVRRRRSLRRALGMRAPKLSDGGVRDHSFLGTSATCVDRLHSTEIRMGGPPIAYFAENCLSTQGGLCETARFALCRLRDLPFASVGLAPRSRGEPDGPPRLPTHLALSTHRSRAEIA